MRSGALAVMMLLPFTATAWAQTPLTVGEPPALVASLSPDAVVDRIMVFDRNSDGRVAKDELIERMQVLLTRGDANGDGALDTKEVLTLASAPPAPQKVNRVIQSGGGWSFSTVISFSSSSRIEDVLDDLRLSSSTKAEVLDIVKTFVDANQQSAAAALLSEMEQLLPPERLADFKQVLERQRRAGIHNLQGDGVSGRIVERNVSMVVSSSDLERRLAAYSLSEADGARAFDAVLEYKERIRLGEPERAALMGQLARVLTDEERDNFRASLDRRPLVKSNRTAAISVTLDRSVQFTGNADDVSVFRID